MRIGVISDTHGFLDARIMEIIGRCDLAVHAGDIGNAGVLEQLRPRREQILAVRGNNDTPQKWPRTDAAVLDGLPDEVAVDLPGGCLVVVHGHRNGPPRRRHAKLRTRYPDARVIVYGHSHRLVCDQDQRPWVLNPGAAGRSRTFGGPSCLVLHVRATRWRVEGVRIRL